MNLKKAAIYTILATTALISIQPSTYERMEQYFTNRENKQKAQEILTNLPHVTVSPQSQERITTALTTLEENDNHTILRTASWCPPCNALEDRLHRTHASVGHTVFTETDEEGIYFRRTAAEHGIYIPQSLPTIAKNVNGHIITFSGYIPERDIMFAPSGEEIPLRKIIEKNN